MSIVLTYWQDPKIKNRLEDYDEIESIRIKSVVEIPILIINKPKKCTMISTEHSAFRKLKNGQESNFFKIIWEK